jgi:2-polyprenyl-3-methyl-5-hydroxy-6-metoxy-1,4-benzoquinol methylase
VNREMAICEICKNEHGNKSFVAREMMFGFRDELEYIECGNCGCLALKEMPDNISKYYPEHYYSLMKRSNADVKNRFLERFLRHQRMKYYLYAKNFLGAVISKIYGPPYYFHLIEKVKLKLDSAILDVGCGRGDFLLHLHNDGFSNLTGVDPFIKEDILYGNGVRILKKEISEIEKQFDFIILNHSFEHMSKPLSVLRQLFRLLRPERYLLIRTPVASSYAWKKYGVNWVALDAPRHIFVHTVKSIEILAKEVGFQITDVVYDSTEFQFWGSEQYVRDIPLRSNRSYAENPEQSLFSPKEIESFRNRAAELNQKKEGDSASFYLYKPLGKYGVNNIS